MRRKDLVSSGMASPFNSSRVMALVYRKLTSPRQTVIVISWWIGRLDFEARKANMVGREVKYVWRAAFDADNAYLSRVADIECFGRALVMSETNTYTVERRTRSCAAPFPDDRDHHHRARSQSTTRHWQRIARNDPKATHVSM